MSELKEWPGTWRVVYILIQWPVMLPVAVLRYFWEAVKLGWILGGYWQEIMEKKL